MHLSVDSAVAHKNLKGSLVSPGVVPGVDTEPVILAVLSSPTDSLDSVTAKLGAGSVLVNTRLVGEEIFVDGEGSSHRAVLVDVSLDGIH